MPDLKNIGIVINNKSINFNLGIISLVLSKLKYNEKINLCFINTNRYKADELPSLKKLYDKHLNISNFKCIDVFITNNKLEKINTFKMNEIKKFKFEFIITREQKNIIPISDRIITLLFKFKNIYLLEDNMFGYYLDKKNNFYLNKFYFINALIANIYFIFKMIFYNNNYLGIFKIFFPNIYTIRKISKFRKSIFSGYNMLINKEIIIFNEDEYPKDKEKMEALILLDVYHFKKNNYYANKPHISEIENGVNMYMKILKKISEKFKIKEQNIKFKIHPMTDEYLMKIIRASSLKNFLMQGNEQKQPLELTVKNYNNLKYCFALGSSSLIFLRDLYQIDGYFIKSKLKINEPNYKYFKNLINDKKVNYISF